ncbi:MAG: hypothetical protein WC586_07185 [Methanoregula sp.]
MNTKLTGIFRDGDMKELREWIGNVAGASTEQRSEIADLRAEVFQIRLSVEAIQKKVDNIERLLTNLAE